MRVCVCVFSCISGLGMQKCVCLLCVDDRVRVCFNVYLFMDVREYISVCEYIYVVWVSKQ